MAEREFDNDSDTPEDLTSHQGMKQDELIRQVQRQHKDRLVKERKERRRNYLKRLTPRELEKKESDRDEMMESEPLEESQGNKGMLPDHIVKLLAAREKKVFTSDSEDEKVEKKPSSKKKRPRKSGLEPIILSEIPAAQCVQSSLEFLNKQKMQVPRSSAVLKNPNQALRLLSVSGKVKFEESGIRNA